MWAWSLLAHVCLIMLAGVIERTTPAIFVSAGYADHRRHKLRVASGHHGPADGAKTLIVFGTGRLYSMRWAQCKQKPHSLGRKRVLLEWMEIVSRNKISGGPPADSVTHRLARGGAIDHSPPPGDIEYSVFAPAARRARTRRQ